MVAFTPLRVAEPATVNELAEVIRTATSVRMAGALHSFNACFVADETTTLVSMRRLCGVDSVVRDGDGASVWVQAGTTLGALNQHLHAQGLALASLPTSESITIGGAIANGVHGSGLKAPAVLAEQVLGIRLVTSDGELVEVAKEDLPIARIGLGTLGAVAAVRLRVVPAFELLSFEDVRGPEALEADAVRAALATHDHAMYIYDPIRNVVLRRFLTRVSEENAAAAAQAKPKTGYDRNTSLRDAFDHFALRFVHALHLDRFAGALLRRTHQARESRVGPSHLMFQDNYNHPSRDTSYGVPLENAAAALAEVRAAFRDIGYAPHVPFAVRFLKGTSETALAVNSGRDTAVIELVHVVEFGDYREAQAVFEKIMRHHGGRPHWAKEFTRNPIDGYPTEAWQRFAALADKWGRKFVNAWAAEFLGLKSSNSQNALDPPGVDAWPSRVQRGEWSESATAFPASPNPHVQVGAGQNDAFVAAPRARAPRHVGARDGALER